MLRSGYAGSSILLLSTALGLAHLTLALVPFYSTPLLKWQY